MTDEGVRETNSSAIGSPGSDYGPLRQKVNGRKRRPQLDRRARVILINGAPSAGKTTIARALQAALPKPFLYVGVDDFIGMYPDRSALGTVVPASEGGQRIELTTAGRRLLYGFHDAVAALAAAGNRLIVDDLLLDRAIVDHWRIALVGVQVLMVGVRCPLDELERREAVRPERTPGLARGYFLAAHEHAAYDVELDSALTSPEDCAALVAAAWAAAEPPAAFRTLPAPACG